MGCPVLFPRTFSSRTFSPVLFRTFSFGSRYHRAVGTVDELHEYADNIGKKWVAGQRECDQLLH
jgi:hypothetical protein